MKKLVLTAIFILSAALCPAADLPAPDAALIEKAGIPVYGKSVFAYGNASVGFRFASAEPPETVRQWYRDKLSSWAVFDQYGSWILYNGKPGIGMGELMGMNQVLIQANENLPAWHSLDKNMTTEILIMVPQ